MRYIKSYENKIEIEEDIKIIDDIIGIMQFIDHSVVPNNIKSKME